MSFYLPGPGETVLPALQRPHFIHMHLPANQNTAVQTSFKPNIARAVTGWFQRGFGDSEVSLSLSHSVFYSVSRCQCLSQELHSEILETISSAPVTHARLVLDKKKPIPLKLLTPKIVEV